MDSSFFVIALLGQLLSGVVTAVGVMVGLRLALPSLARALAREMDEARYQGVEAAVNPESESGCPVVTLEPREELRNGA